jgi:drug/metabolite transporter (DMT)-like permease
LAHKTGLASTIIAGVLFGTSVPVIKLGLEVIPPFLFATLRFLVASAVVVFLLGRRGWLVKELYRSKLMCAIGILNTLGYALQFEGQFLTTASEAALIIGSASLMIPVVALLRGKEKLVWSRSLGVLVGFAGTSLVVAGRGSMLGGGQFTGDLLILGTAVTIALIFVFSKDLVEARGSSGVTGGILITTAVLLLPFTILDLGTPISLGLDSWFYILFLAIFSTVGSYYFFAKGLETVSATVSSIILPIEVVVSVVLSVLIFRDPFSLFSGTGAVLIIAGVVMVSMS